MDRGGKTRNYSVGATALVVNECFTAVTDDHR